MLNLSEVNFGLLNLASVSPDTWWESELGVGDKESKFCLFVVQTVLQSLYFSYFHYLTDFVFTSPCKRKGLDFNI